MSIKPKSYLLTIFLIFILSFSVSSQEINYGTDINLLEKQQEQAKGAKRFLKTIGKILYAPFKFKGELDPSIADMDVEATFDDQNSTEQPSKISFITPKDGQSFNPGVDIPVQLEASHPNTSFAVLFEVKDGATKIFNSPPYFYNVQNLPNGTYQLKATVQSSEWANGENSYKHITIHIGATQNNDDSIAINVYPNPVSEKATISYNASKEITDISLFDIAGRRVRVISDEALPSGEHQLSFKVDTLSAGIYVLQLSEGDITHYKKIVVER